MDVTEVPLIESSSLLTIDDALSLMKSVGRAAIAIGTDDESEYRLVFAGRLLEARQNGLQLVRDVSESYSVQSRLASAFADGDDDSGFAISDSPPTTDGPFLGAEPQGERLRVITRHETFAALINGADFYQCNGSPTHYFPDPYVRLGDECPYSAICAPQGGESKIVDAG